jgi:(E)-4-hydroxy-3-methylbut-2-enyl-diphosphate synthase
MTTTTPEDLAGSLAQIRALRRAGCRIVRLAVPSRNAAAALPALRRAMAAGGLSVPLVADVHFTPDLALAAAPHVEKVRINPGNFAAGPREARRHLARLVEALRRRRAALRVGVNHGSLAPYVVARFGQGPEGMVASALEYLRLCRALDFHAAVVSLKASNPALMVEANRRLARRMATEGLRAPIHLGVTEAGEGVEGALRSAAGIGALLLDGIGDTIRVSLAGDPADEIPVGRRLLRAVARAGESPAFDAGTRPAAARAWLVRSVERPGALLAHRHDPRAPVDALAVRATAPTDRIVSELSRARSELRRRRAAPEVWLELDASRAPAALPPGLSGAVDRIGFRVPVAAAADPAGLAALTRDLRRLTRRARLGEPALSWDGRPRVAAGRALARAAGPGPLLLPRPPADAWEAAVTLGSLLLDGRADGILLPPRTGSRPLRAAAFGGPERFGDELLQATRRRVRRVEFIACPGCGRLHYDLAGTVRRLKRRLAGASGVKIAVMGCAVNGPGEMADADFGYVGSSGGRVDLYAGRACLRRRLTPAAADRCLMDLLRARGCLRRARPDSARRPRRTPRRAAASARAPAGPRGGTGRPARNAPRRRPRSPR